MPWSSSDRRSRLPADWDRRRVKVLKRDHFECQWRMRDGTICGAYANQCDHIDAGDDHSLENLQALCETHHKPKSSSEGGRAAQARRRMMNNRFKRVEDHPGLM